MPPSADPALRADEFRLTVSDLNIITSRREPVSKSAAKAIAIASQAGYRCFVTASELKRYVLTEILVQEGA